MTDDQLVLLLGDALAEVAPGRVDQLDEAMLRRPIGSLGLESVTLMELVGLLEERSGVLFADEELARVRSIGDLGALVEGRALP